MTTECPFFLTSDYSTQKRFSSKTMRIRWQFFLSWEAFELLETRLTKLGIFPNSRMCFMIEVWLGLNWAAIPRAVCVGCNQRRQKDRRSMLTELGCPDWGKAQEKYLPIETDQSIVGMSRGVKLYFHQQNKYSALLLLLKNKLEFIYHRVSDIGFS